MDIRLIHDGDHWIGYGDNLTAKGSTLLELDNNVRRILLESGEFSSGSKITVFMGYDFDTFPTWLRQYHNHYFNRYVEFDL